MSQFNKGYPVIYMKDGEFVEFQANKDYGSKDIIVSVYDGKVNKRMKITMTIGDCNCSLKDTDTKQYSRGEPGQKAKVYIPDKLSEILLTTYKINKGERYRIQRLDKFTLGIKNLTRGEQNFVTHDTEAVQPAVQKNMDINKPEDDDEAFEVPINDKEAVKSSIKGYESEKEKLTVYRAVSQRIEGRLLKAVSFAKMYFKDEVAQIMVARYICDAINGINIQLMKQNKPTIDYVPSLEEEEIKEEEENIKENAKEQLK